MTVAYNLCSRELHLIHAPFNGGQNKIGVDEGPAMLRKAGLVSELQSLDWQVSEINLDMSTSQPDTPVGHVKRPRQVSEACRKVASAVESSLEKRAFALTVGGDHSIATGTISGVHAVYKDACVLWIDAHADINTPDMSESGNLHGCPVSFVLGTHKTGNSTIAEMFSWVPQALDVSRLAYIGLRDLDDYEKSFLREHNVAAYTMHHVDKYGIAQVLQMALDRINPGNTRPVHLSFDVDAIDPLFAPSTGTPVRGGLTSREAMYLCEAVAETGQLVAMDVVELNPHLGPTEQHSFDTVRMALSLIKCALGDVLL